jgi:hypothetical protein
VSLSGEAKGALGGGVDVGGKVTLKNPYNKEWRSKNFASIKNNITSGNPKQMAKGIRQALKEGNPAAVLSRALGINTKDMAKNAKNLAQGAKQRVSKSLDNLKDGKKLKEGA